MLIEKVSKMNTINSIWWYNPRIRLTYVSKGWLVVWDHSDSPPKRYDCKDTNHGEACHVAVQTLSDLANV